MFAKRFDYSTRKPDPKQLKKKVQTMEYHTTDRVNAIKPSATVAINGKAQALRAQGVDIINLSVGEPDFDTPAHIKQAGIDAINAGHTRYTAVDGIAPLKEAIIRKFERENQLKFAADQVIVTCGAKQGLYNLVQAVVNPSDEVVIPAPCWVSYTAMVKLASGTPVVVPTSLENRFKITAEELEKAITPKTRIVMLNSPSNPTGMAYKEAELKAIGEVMKKHPNVLIASDDIYEHILWGADRYLNILNVCPELTDQTIIFNGVSKSYAMTGWRIGYAAGPKPIITQMKKIQSHSTSNPTSISQYAAIAALDGDASFLTEIKNTFKERHDYFQAAIDALPGFSCPKADGAFYLFPDVREAMKQGGYKNDIELAEAILEKAHVAVVPGTAFSAPGFIRLSFADNVENLKSAVDRISSLLAVSVG